MKRLPLKNDGFTQPVDSQQAGFIPLMLLLLAIIVTAVVYAYIHVIKSGK